MNMKFPKITPFQVWTVILTACLVIGLRYWDPELIQSYRLKTFDAHLNEERTASQDVVIIDLGEPSMAVHGQWPWNRRVLGDIIRKVADAGADTIVVPILMVERDRLGGDTYLAESMRNKNVVIAQTPTTQNREPDAVRRGVAMMGEDPRE